MSHSPYNTTPTTICHSHSPIPIPKPKPIGVLNHRHRDRYFLHVKKMVTTPPSLRLRLVFKDRTILSEKQRSDGMNQCWVLIKPQLHKTIADVCDHLVHVFRLNRSCPNGVLLTMEGFAFTPFESTEILNDKDIICVKKKGGATTDALEAEDEGNLLEEEVEDDGLENGNRGLLLLANDNKGKEVYQSESEDVDEDQSLGEDSPEEAVCKKRKASRNLQNLKKKKRCLRVLDDEDDTETEEVEDLRKVLNRKKKLVSGNSKPNEESNKTAGTSNKNLQSPSTANRSEQHQENVEEVNQVSNAPRAKKMSSRSSRRKQLKRRWKQELAKIAKNRPQAHSKPEVTKAGNKEANGHPKGLVSKQAHSKPEVTKAGNKEANGHPKGLLHWKQASKNNVQNGDAGPIVSKPVHIRFECSEEDQPAKQTRVSNETFNRNSSSSKRKGQKWGGRERFLAFQRNESKRMSKESFKMLFKDAQVPVIDPNDFDKLPPCCEPKEGDVIAYRLLELNSSWIPEMSSFRVGRISYYDAKDIVLIPVPEYPIVLGDIKEDGPNESLYGEDGTLEINYSALVDVRNVEQYVPDATKAASNGVNQTSLSSDMDASENLVSNSNDNNTDVHKDSNPGNGEVNPWDQFSKANPNASQSEMVAYMVASALNQCSDGAAGPSTSTAGHGAAGPSTSTAGPTTVTAGPSTSTAGTTTSTAPDANEEELSKEKDEQQKDDTSDPWLNANKTGPSEVSNVSWTEIQKTGPAADDNGENGSSWGRPWSSFAPSRSSAVKQPNQENNWYSGSSRGNGKPWSRGASRGRGRGGGRGRGRGRNATM